MIIFTIIGVAVAAWWTLGILLAVFGCQTYMHPQAPLTARMSTLFSAGWAMPQMLLTNGSLPLIVVMPAEPSPQDEAAFEAWRKANCNCPSCRANRGER